MDLICVFCLFVRKQNAEKAVTIMNGQAVCGDHVYYTRSGEFTHALAMVVRDEKKD